MLLPCVWAGSEVVQELIKEIAQSAPIITASSGGASTAPPAFKVVVLNEVERLSKPAQHGLPAAFDMPSALLDGPAPSARLVPPRAQAAPTHSGAPPERRGGSP
jgi:hypothetical protein